MATEATPAAKPSSNRISPPSILRRWGSQMGIIGVGLVMWITFVIAAPAVFTNIDIYVAFAETTPVFGIIALALTFVVITGEIDLSFPSTMALGTAIFCLSVTQWGMPWYVGMIFAFLTGIACGLVNGLLVARLNIPSLVITIGTQFLFRGLELVLMNGTGVPLTEDQYPALHILFREPLFGALPIETVWMVVLAVILWLLLNRTRFGAHVFLVGDNPTSARLMGIGVASVKIRTFVLVGVMAVFAGLMVSIYGYYFWPTTGDGYLLTAIASVFLGGTSVF
ncbi:MAG TPA: ABC transporter permease, partial [Devosia sp.]|nr:ABC transporter permease [Devosia sp.]